MKIYLTKLNICRNFGKLFCVNLTKQIIVTNYSFNVCADMGSRDVFRTLPNICDGTFFD